MKRMSWASRSQSPARSATQPAAPWACSRLLSAFARAWRACLCAFADPFELDPLRRAVLVAILPPPVYESPTQEAGTHTRGSSDRDEARPHVRADVHELALLELELLELRARQLCPHVAAGAGLEVDPDLEAEVHDALHLHLLGAFGRQQEDVEVVGAHVRLAELCDRADELQDDLVRRRVVQLARRADLLDAALVHDH